MILQKSSINIWIWKGKHWKNWPNADQLLAMFFRYYLNYNLNSCKLLKVWKHTDIIMAFSPHFYICTYIHIQSRKMWKITNKEENAFWKDGHIIHLIQPFIVENLGNTNMKTKKIKVTHNPVTQTSPVSIWYKNPSNIVPKYRQSIFKILFFPLLIVF